MDKYVKYALIGLPILVGGYIVFTQLKAKKKDSTLPPSPTPSPTPTPSGGDGVIKVRSDFPLKKGSKGAKVVELQKLILQKDNKALPRFGADGLFGSETENALNNLFGKKQIKSQAELDELKPKTLPTYKAGSPLVFQYQQPTNVSPFLNIPNPPIR